MATRDENVFSFLTKLSAATPTPGGGSAAALVGSISASLVAMVAGLTLGKKAYQSVEHEMRSVLSEALTLRDELIDYADRDSAAFDAVMAAYQLPKENEVDRVEREKAIQVALQQATEVPYQTALRCFRVLELAEIVVTKGNKNALSDGGTAACLAEGALQAALLNVAMNLSALADEAFRSKYSQARERLSAQAQAKRLMILQIVSQRGRA
ncbi:MAG: cyclodeaminase/cyclohydrolase family protein [Candidatus Bipolaricaulota bacterium]|nr:cyclodeaminase/cyclohydrolase family protein [Candidatus Bipolaricaulota bacterium]MDW8030803.1 cyclodeaminase/cyclohydrolase family protein [Candidatus Bipolaricaulota bacterium]